MKIIVTIICFYFLFNNGTAQNELVLKNSKTTYELNPKSYIYFDKTNSLSITDVNKAINYNQFISMKLLNSSLGYHKETVWIKFTINNLSDENKWYLDLNWPLFDKVSLFIPNKNIFWESKSGLAYKAYEKEINNRNVLFPIFININASRVYFLKIISDKSIPLKLKILSHSKFYSVEINKLLISGIFYGALFIMALYNLFLYISIKDTAYLLYTIYSLSLCFYLSHIDGLLFQYILPNATTYKLNSINISGYTFLITASLFSQKFLQIKRYSTILNNIYILVIISFAVFLIFSISLNYTDTSFTTPFSIIYFSLAFFSSIYCLNKGNLNARYYLIGLSALGITLLDRLLFAFGLDNWSVLQDYGLQIGTLIEMTIFSFALGNRINTIKQEEEKEKALIRSRIASDLHDEIGSNLSSISLSSQLIKKSSNLSEKDIYRLEEITTTTKETADSIRDIIWFLNPEHDKNDDLLSKMKNTAARMLPGIYYTFNSNNGIHFKNIQVRRNIFLIFKEILNNIAKHSEARNVAINVEDSSSIFQLKIKDDGKGFDRNNIVHGNGLKNIERRVREINGKLNIESKLGLGTCISMYVEK